MTTPAKLLYINTSDEVGKVCLGDDCLTWPTQGRAELVLRKIDQLLTKHHLTLKALKQIKAHPGPGSFTGARVSVSVANALNWSQGKRGLVSPTYRSKTDF